uniref:Uncharacterized protein n=1 Tax=Udotea flabellum TaxID=170437 RepID=A0A386B1X1_9CHLO|nr:hypothetical protein [Udotea flabellum]AYC65673.1 hypothetical protein [Udotea flabellum]
MNISLTAFAQEAIRRRCACPVPDLPLTFCPAYHLPCLPSAVLPRVPKGAPYVRLLPPCGVPSGHTGGQYPIGGRYLPPCGVPSGHTGGQYLPPMGYPCLPQEGKQGKGTQGGIPHRGAVRVDRSGYRVKATGAAYSIKHP